MSIIRNIKWAFASKAQSGNHTTRNDDSAGSVSWNHLYMKKVLWGLGISLVVLLMNGCILNREIIDERVYQVSNPTVGKIVKISRVTDSRVFQIKPSSPNVPTIMGNKIDDKAITSRAIGRKRNGFGGAMGDILLPEGRTVEGWVRQALTTSLRRAGYRVVDDASGATKNAIPIEVDIEQFWIWMPLNFIVHFQFDTKIRIKGDIPPFEKGQNVSRENKCQSNAIFSLPCSDVISVGVNRFIKKTTYCLIAQKMTASPSAISGTSCEHTYDGVGVTAFRSNLYSSGPVDQSAFCKYCLLKDDDGDEIVILPNDFLVYVDPTQYLRQRFSWEKKYGLGTLYHNNILLNP